MKSLRLVLLSFFLSLVLCACNENGIYSGKIILDGNLIISADEVEESDILLVDGTLTVAEGGKIRGNIYQILGIFNLNGSVEGNLAQMSGVLILGESARILGNLQIGGGILEGQPEHLVSGEITTSQVRVPFSPEWLAESFKRQFSWAVGETLILALFAVVLATAFPAQMQNISLAVQKYSIVSAAMGLLVGIVGLSLIVQMIFTVLLIPVSLIGVFLIFLAIGAGWVGFGWLTGQWLENKTKANWHPQVTAGIGTLTFMAIINILDLLPGIGDLLSIISAIIGLGAVSLTRFGLRRFIPANAKGVDIP